MENIRPVRVAVVGCGKISGIYLENMAKHFRILELAACCDLNAALAEAVSRKYGIPAMRLEDILEDERIEVILNLTAPAAHYDIIRAALERGKHVYTEKVMAVRLEQAQALARMAEERHVMLCAAPDTFLGGAIQTARFAVDHGLIGEVTSCTAICQRDAGLLAEKYPFTTREGGGIGLDVGIYDVTALLSILGPVETVCGMTDTYKPQRVHTFPSGKHFDEAYRIEGETLLAATMRFACGAVGSLHFNAGSIRYERPPLVLYGTQGILFLPDPNSFGGEVQIVMKGQQTPCVLPHTHAYDGNERGLGVAEMAWSLRRGRAPRAGKEMALHGLEVLTGAIESGRTGKAYSLRSTFVKPSPLPRGYMGESYGGAEPEAALAF